MSSKFGLWPVTVKRFLRRRHYRLPAALAAVAMLVQGCAQTPPQLFAGADPADASVRVPPVAYRSVVAGYASQRPVGPKPWREQNDSVAPAQKK